MTLHFHRSRWGAVLIGVLAATLAGNPVAAAPNTIGDKVSPQVRAAAEKGDKITFWVTFHARAGLDGAKAKSTKAAKGAEVMRALKQTADTSQASVRKLLDNTGADYQPFWISNRIKVTGSTKLLDTIAAMPEVATIEETKTLKLPEPITEPKGIPSINAVEWGVDRIGAPRVWSELGSRGEGIVVANIDTGAQFNHPALVNQYRGNSGGSFDHNYNWFDPSSVCPSPAPCDNNNHGTHTMGTMAGDDGGTNQIGVAPGAKWIAAKGCESNGCSDAALLASGEWIVAPTDLSGQNPRPDLAPDIVNNSWGGSGFDPFYKDIVAAWLAAGIFPAFSNGNSGPACNTSGSPGQYVESYSSGAFDINNAIASFSSRGSGEGGEIKPNLAAPGVNVRSSIAGGGYGSFSGTSMASPHTAGAVALLWSAAPSLLGDINATRELLDDTAIDVDNTTCGGTAEDNNVFGEGRLDAFAAVSNAPRGPVGALNGTITSGGSPVEGATVTAEGPIQRVTTTAADGTYSFPVLSVGDYEVTASKFGFLPASGNVTVTDGGTATLDLSLTSAASATVSGTVSAASGPVAGATVALSGTALSTTTNAAGFYSLTAPQGTYQLAVSSPLRCFDSVTQTITLDSDITVDVELPTRTDAFGYACGDAGGSYPSVSTLVNLAGDDAQTTVPLPFPVPLYGRLYSSVSISTNGHADFGAAAVAFSNTAIPNTAAPNGALYPFWDDLNVDASAAVYTGVVGTSPHRQFVIEWRNVRHFSDAAARLSFVAMIGEDGTVVFRYKDLAGGALSQGSSATIGIENATGTDAFQYSFNTAVLTDGTAIAFRTTKHGVVRGTVTDANDGLAVAGATVDFGAGNTATTAADGTYLIQVPAGDLSVTVSKASYETAALSASLEPATVEILNASLATANVTANPPGLDVVVPADQIRTRLITVTNTGGLATPVTVTEVGGDVPWLGASLGTGSLEPGQSTQLAVTVNTAGLTPGSVYPAALKLTSQSGRNPELLVQINLVVPGFQHAIDAGSNRSHLDPQGDTWTADVKYVPGEGCGWIGSSSVKRTNKAIAGTDDQARFADARQNMYEYRCDGLENGTYTVELNFAEIAGLKPNKRIFDVMIEGVEVIPNLDISLEVGTYTAYSRTFTAEVNDGVLNIRFVRHSGFNKTLVNALRVTHRPDLAS